MQIQRFFLSLFMVFPLCFSGCALEEADENALQKGGAQEAPMAGELGVGGNTMPVAGEQNHAGDNQGPLAGEVTEGGDASAGSDHAGHESHPMGGEQAQGGMDEPQQIGGTGGGGMQEPQEEPGVGGEPNGDHAFGGHHNGEHPMGGHDCEGVDCQQHCDPDIDPDCEDPHPCQGEDCVDPCADGNCEPPVCGPNGDCPPGFECGGGGICECLNENCEPPPIDCQNHPEDPRCQQGCDPNNGNCEPPPPPPCDVDADCPDGVECKDGVCDCPNGFCGEPPPDCQNNPDDPRCCPNGDCGGEVDCDTDPLDFRCPPDCENHPEDPRCPPDCQNDPDDPRCQQGCDPADGNCEPPPCANDTDCPEGQACIDNQCQCPQGQNCEPPDCFENPDDPRCCPNGDCGGEVDCDTDPLDFRCPPDCENHPEDPRCQQGCDPNNGNCEPPPPPPCDVDADCPDGVECKDGVCDCPNGFCGEPPPDCQNNPDDPRCCPNGDCGGEVDCDTDPLDFRCPPDCENHPEDPRCQQGCDPADGNCEPPLDCQNNPDDPRCQQGCDPNNENCEPPPPPPCDVDADCPDGVECKDGVCDCPNGFCGEPPLDCQNNPNDPRCQQGCDPNNENCEPPPDCQIQEDCPEGQACIDNQCQCQGDGCQGNGEPQGCDEGLGNASVATAFDLRQTLAEPSEGTDPEFEVGHSLQIEGGQCNGQTDWFKVYLRKGEEFDISINFGEQGQRSERFDGPEDAADENDLDPLSDDPNDPDRVLRTVSPQNPERTFVVTQDGWQYIKVPATNFTLTLAKTDHYDCASLYLRTAREDVGMDDVSGIAHGERACIEVENETGYAQLQVVECSEDGELEVVQDCLDDLPVDANPSCGPDGNLGNRLGCTVDGSFGCSAYGLVPGETSCVDGWSMRCFSNGGEFFAESSAAIGQYQSLDLSGLASNVVLENHLLYNPKEIVLFGAAGSREDSYLLDQTNCADPESSGFPNPRSCGYNHLTERHMCLGPWSDPENGSQGGEFDPTDLDRQLLHFPSSKSIVSCFEPNESRDIPWTALDTVGTIYTPHDVLRAKPKVDTLHNRGIPAIGYYSFISIEPTTPEYSRAMEINGKGNPVYMNEVYARLNPSVELFDPDCSEYQDAVDLLELSDEAIADLAAQGNGQCNHQIDAVFVPIHGLEEGTWGIVNACRSSFREMLKYTAKLSVLAGLDGAVYDVANWDTSCFGQDYVNDFYSYLGNLDVNTKAEIDLELQGTGLTSDTLEGRDWPELLIAAAGDVDENDLNHNPHLGADPYPALWNQWEFYTTKVQRDFALDLRTEVDRFSQYDPGDPNSERFTMAFNRYTNGVAFLFDDVADYALAETFISMAHPTTGELSYDGIPYPLTTLESVHSAFRNRPESRRFWSWNFPGLIDPNSETLRDDRHALFLAENLSHGGIAQTAFCHVGFYCGEDPINADNPDVIEAFGGYELTDYAMRQKLVPLYEYVRDHGDWLEFDNMEAEIGLYWSLPSTEDVHMKLSDGDPVGQLSMMKMTDRIVRGLGYTVNVLASGSEDWLVQSVVPEEKLSQYSVLVVAGAEAMGDDQVQSLLNFVTQGGTLVVIGDAGTRNALNELTQSENRTALQTEGALGAGTIVIPDNQFEQMIVDSNENSHTVPSALSLAWQAQPDMRVQLSSWMSGVFDPIEFYPSHQVDLNSWFSGEVHVTQQSNEAAGSTVIHLVNYTMEAELGREIYSERAGECNARDVYFATNSVITEGSVYLEVPDALKQTGGTLSLARLGYEDISLDFGATLGLNLFLHDAKIKIGESVDPAEFDCDDPENLCVDLAEGEGFETWWMIKFDPPEENTN